MNLWTGTLIKGFVSDVFSYHIPNDKQAPDINILVMFSLESNLPENPRSHHKYRTWKVSFIEMNEVNQGI